MEIYDAEEEEEDRRRRKMRGKTSSSTTTSVHRRGLCLQRSGIHRQPTFHVLIRLGSPNLSLPTYYGRGDDRRRPDGGET